MMLPEPVVPVESMSVVREERIGNARLILGDCREILPTLGRVDAVVTDPPYGIGFEYASYVDSRENLRELISSVVPWSLGNANRAIYLCGITQIHEYPTPDWIAAVTWDTTGQFGKCGYTQWMPIVFYGTDVSAFGNVEGLVTKSDLFRITGGAGVGFARGEVIDHPCPKPVNIMDWCVARFSKRHETVLDPFAGSGTTGVSCARLGRPFIGIEQNPNYFDIACRRIEAAQRQADLFVTTPAAPRPVTGELFA